jgi:hypothetical protein
MPACPTAVPAGPASSSASASGSETALQDHERFRFQRIRERQGALRIHWGGRLSATSEAAVREAVDLAEARNICLCELCGAQGRLYRADGVLMTPSVMPRATRRSARVWKTSI